MKKLLTLTIIILVLSLSLTGCSTPVQETLQSNWQQYERYTYDVEYNQESIGTLTLISERINNDTVLIGGHEFANQTGTKISYELNINDSTDYIHAEVLFQSNKPFTPIYSYKKTIIDDAVTTIEGNYTNKKKYNYSITKDDEVIQDSLSIKAPLYDNEMVYYIVRCIKMTSNFNFKFNVPSPLDNNLQQRTVALVKKVNINILDESRECYEVSMNTDQRMRGDNFLLYYSTTPIAIDDEDLDEDERQVYNPLVRFIEGDYTYTLQDVTTNPNKQ